MDSAVEPRHRQAAPSHVLHLVQDTLPGNDGCNGSARSPISTRMLQTMVVCEFFGFLILFLCFYTLVLGEFRCRTGASWVNRML